MICPHCKTRNPIGNKFCRECGEKLTLPEGSLAAEEAARVSAERDAEKYAALLVEAHALSDVKKYDAAIPIAEEAVKILPESTSAYSLLAILYERTDKEKQAIAAMEKVVALNPHSEADKIKLDQLRRGVHVLPRQAAPPPTATRLQNNTPLPWLPLALAGGVAFSVLGGGLFWLNQRPRGQNPPPKSLPAATAPPISAANPSGTAPQYVPPTSPYSGTIPTALPPPTVPASAPPASEVRPDPFAPVGPAKPSLAPVRPVAGRTGNRRGLPAVPVAPVTVAPPPSGTGGDNGLPSIPVGPPPSGDSGANGTAAPGTAPGFGSGGVLPVGPPPSQPPANGGAAPSGGASSGNGTSYIHITVGGKNGSGGGDRPANGANSSPRSGGGSPLSRARALQQAGQYRDAIAAYREAAGGGAGGGAYQGMAQCYENLNEPGGARNAYRDAIRAYQSQGSKASAQRGIASCKAALEVLGGG